MGCVSENSESLNGTSGRHNAIDEKVNSGGFRRRSVPAVIRPGSVEEVCAALHNIAEQRDAHLHAISSGQNWGFGSAESVIDDAVLMDMREMNAIRSLDTNAGVCIIEPGVTQGDLADALVGTDYLLNVTASASTTSVVGNTLERGIGLRRQRSEDLIGLEVVLADGTVARVGRWPRSGTHTSAYDHVPGPNLVQLFAQSGFAVVTAAVVRLIPRSDLLRIVRLRFEHERLHEVMARVRVWHADRLAAGVIKVFDAGALAAYGGDEKPAYQMYVPVAGHTAVVASTTQVLVEAAASAGLQEAVVLDPDDDVTSVAERAALRAYAGDPSANDAMVNAIFDVPLDEVDVRGRDGWLFCVPVAPLDPGALVEIVTAIKTHADRHPNMTVGHTLNVMPSGWVDVVVSIRFEPTTELRREAHDLLQGLHSCFIAKGFPPYRLDVDHMGIAHELRGDAGQEALIARIKQLFDPGDVIERGRYA